MRYLGSPRTSPQSVIVTLIALALLLCLPGLVHAQPVAITPEDVSRERQFTHFSSDWTTTHAFDLDSPVELVVTIQALRLPDKGNAEVLFTTREVDVKGLPLRGDSRQIYHGTLQLADEVRRLGINDHKLERLQEARITGWPATDRNHTPSILLVDEIEMLHTGQRYVLHDYPEMARRRTDRPGSPERDWIPLAAELITQ